MRPLTFSKVPDFSAHVLAATPTRHWLEYMDWGQMVLNDPVVPVAGRVEPRAAPGAGLDWNEAELTRHIVEA